jgi:hypothetical protein
MKYTLRFKDEGSREEFFDSLDEISSSVEGIDWASGNYQVFDENGVEYLAEWIERPTERRSLGILRTIEIGSYRLVPKNPRPEKITP